jgi:DNA invertase Pin-like site-specific DNA recombinase
MNKKHIRNNVFFEKLGASSEAVKKFESEYSKHSVNLTRNSEREKRKKLKETQKDIVRELLKNGETYKTISEKVGLSTSTIYRIAKENGNKKTEEKPWEQLNISRATYYRRKKQKKL